MKNNNFSQNQESPESSDKITCPKCNGRGEVKLPDAMGMPRVPEYVTCRMCGGNGNIPNVRK